MKIKHPLFHDMIDIKAALSGVAGQENCDGPDYDLMMSAADYIAELEDHIKELKQKLYDLDLAYEYQLELTQSIQDFYNERI